MLYLVELVSDLLDLASSSADHRLVEPLLDEDVPGLLILLENQKYRH